MFLGSGRREKVCVWAFLLPSLELGICIYCLLSLTLVKTMPRRGLEALVLLSVVPVPIKMTLWKEEALLASKKGMEFNRWRVK